MVESGRACPPAESDRACPVVEFGRACPAAETVSRVLGHARSLGITRVAVLTGLDVIGIPVVAAYRPNSRSVAVHQGKGVTLDAARASALMEALECHHAERYEAVTRFATWHGIGDDALDPGTLPLAGRRRDVAGLRLPWVRGEDLLSGRSFWVPHELVSADFTAPLAPGHGIFQATTNGLASGNSPDEATLHGLCEVIERDAVTLWRLSSSQRRRASRIDPDSVPDSVDAPLSRWVLRMLGDAGVDVAIWDVTSEIGVPVFMALIEGGGTAWIEPEVGSGCHPTPDRALASALLEAVQTRLTIISGARDDLSSEDFETERRRDRHGVAASWREGTPVRRFGQVQAAGGPGVEDGIASVLARLAGAGFTNAVRVDLTDAAIGIPVARMIVPGLEGGSDADAYSPGARALAA